MTCKLQRLAFLFLILEIASALEQSLLSCETTSSFASGYHCNENGAQNQCGTFAILRTNSYYSSLSNLSLYLGINKFVLAEANGFSADTEFLSKDQPFLIPIDCKCSNVGFFGAELTKTAIKGESFYGIAESLEGLTTCKAIKEKNPSVSPWNLGEKQQLPIPLRCACPSSSSETGSRILISYPVSEGDTISNLAFKFNITREIIISANNRTGSSFSSSQERLEPFSTVLIPLNGKPFLGSLTEPSEPSLGYPGQIVAVKDPRKKRSKMRKIALYIALIGVVVGAAISIGVAFLLIQRKKKNQNSTNIADVELQKLSLSVRATSEKKVSFEGSQDTLDGQIIETTHHKLMVEMYTIDDLRKATNDFNSSSLIEESVFHGRLNGKNLAIKRTNTETVSKIEFGLFHDANHNHPNIIRLIGSCSSSTDGPDSFLVFEYAKNGSLKDWLHGGLAMKSQFIASCYCFLTWNQRVKICLDVATALQYMHQIMTPSYTHRNIKSRNIFLDEEFNAKLGNFGMSKCAVEEKTDESESCSGGHSGSWSKGYLAPEYLHKGIIAPTIDIFAYGVVLLEVLSGKTPITRNNEKSEGTVWLYQKIKLVLQSDDAEELRDWMDNALGENYSFDGAVTLANLARACVEDEPSLRPSAGEIVEKLSKLVEELPETDQFSICESSSKPLVKAGANISM